MWEFSVFFFCDVFVKLTTVLYELRYCKRVWLFKSTAAKKQHTKFQLLIILSAKCIIVEWCFGLYLCNNSSALFSFVSLFLLLSIWFDFFCISPNICSISFIIFLFTWLSTSVLTSTHCERICIYLIFSLDFSIHSTFIRFMCELVGIVYIHQAKY